MIRRLIPLTAIVLLLSCAKVLVEHEITLDNVKEVHQYLRSRNDSTLVMKTVYDSAGSNIEESHFVDLKLNG